MWTLPTVQVNASFVASMPLRSNSGPIDLVEVHLMQANYGLNNPDDAAVSTHVHCFDGR